MDLEWEPCMLLDVYPGTGCAGTRKDGLPCTQKMISNNDIAEANRILSTLRRSDYTARGYMDWVYPHLQRLAEVTLCPRWHRKPSHSQVERMTLKWYNAIRDLRLFAAGRNRRRDPPEERAIRMPAARNPEDHRPIPRRLITYIHHNRHPIVEGPPSPSPSPGPSSSSSSSPSPSRSPNRSSGPRTPENRTRRSRTPESSEEDNQPNSPPQSPRSSHHERESQESQRQRQSRSQRQTQTQTPPNEPVTPPRHSQASPPTPNSPDLETLRSTIATLITVLTTFRQNNIATRPIEEAIATTATSITSLLANNPSPTSPSPATRSSPRGRTSVRSSDSISSHTLGRTPDRSISSRTLSRRGTEISV